MTRRDIVGIQLKLFFGEGFRLQIQRLVDGELNEGRWVEGYHLAVSPDTISGDNAAKLLEIILTEHPELRIDEEELKRAVDTQLPRGEPADCKWIVDESGSFAMTDSLRVARFDGETMIWRSPRVSWDGIEFDKLVDGRLHGRAWMLSDSLSPDVPFVFDFETGELLDGEIVPY